MKKTIREDARRHILRQEYIDDNTLLEFVEEGESILVSIRFVDSGVIREQILRVFPKETGLSRICSMISISDDKEAIALFKAREGALVLEDVYLVLEHSYSFSDFIDICYASHFDKNTLDEYLVYQKDRRSYGVY